jgi:hypothetical protein
VIISVAGEGAVDVAVATRLVENAGHSVHLVLPKGGKSKLDPRLHGYNNAARFAPWLILRDLDTDASCAPALARQLLPEPSSLMLFRIVVRAIEAWLLADTLAFSEFFDVDDTALPAKPDELIDPKRALIEIIAASTNPSIRRAILPGRGTRDIGPGYTGMLIEFTVGYWDIARGRQRSPSLNRCVNALAALES